MAIALGHVAAPTQYVEANGIRFAYRRLILVGTAPRGGEGIASITSEMQQLYSATYDDPDHLFLHGFFTSSDASQTAGRRFLKRLRGTSSLARAAVRRRVRRGR